VSAPPQAASAPSTGLRQASSIAGPPAPAEQPSPSAQSTSPPTPGAKPMPEP
jgi:hypothetical protein